MGRNAALDGGETGRTWWQYNQYNASFALTNPLANSTHYLDYEKSEAERSDYLMKDQWTFIVNGKRIFAHGGNYLPADAAQGRLERDS